MVTALPASQNVSSDFQVEPICIGDGVDAQSLGLLSTLAVPTVIGLVLWLLFAILRPRYRQVYATREWFVHQDLRPRPLGRSFWAFLFPHIPLIPPVPSDVSDAGKSIAQDAELFPSDELLSQRSLWLCLRMSLAWSLLSLAGLLPLYMVDTPCLAHSLPPATLTGAYSVLQDLSLLRLLRLLDNGSITTQTDLATSLHKREVVNGSDKAPNTRTRIIILTVFTIVLGVLPALYLILREFHRLVAYRKRWLNIRCQELEMGWLSARRAPGFVGWGEKRLKDFIIKSGLSSSLESNETSGNGNGGSRRRRTQDLRSEEKAQLEIDVQSLFSIGDTAHLAVLIDERDRILEQLEIAETKYINSFKLSTPDPSVVDFYPSGSTPRSQTPPPVPPKPHISRPLPLGNTAARRRHRGRNPALGSSSLPPTSYVMPSQYYKLRALEGVNGGQLASNDFAAEPSTRQRGPSLAESFNQRVIGSRFQEVNRSTNDYGHLPIGSQVMVDHEGQLGAVSFSESPVPDTAPYGTGAAHASWDTAAFNENPLPPHQWWTHQPGDSIQEEPELELGEDWVDILSEDPEALENAEVYNPKSTPPRRRPRPPRPKPAQGSEDRRETFPLRIRGEGAPEEQPPPHLRVQPRGPFVRPLSGLDHDDLGHIYADINMWRAKLKGINTEISEVQSECYKDIADGARIRGWLMVGRGLRFIPGIQLIEGRAKEDIRWDELQNEGGPARTLAFWTIAITIAVLLGICLTAVAGLSVATAPEFGHYFPFFLPLSSGDFLGAGVAVSLAAAFATVLFVSVAIWIMQHTAQLRNSVSLSGLQLGVFKTVFWTLVVVGGIWLFTAAALLFAFGAFSTAVPASPVVANGAIYMSAFAMSLILTVAVIAPALLTLQPHHLVRVLRAEQAAVTPRQRFRAVYPRIYNPTYAIATCVMAVLLASTFSLIFPLVAPAAALLLLLTLIAHRFLIGYVYGQTRSQTGGVLQLWLIKRLGTLLAFQPLILGLILLSRELWIEGGILCGTALLVVLVAEGFCAWRTRLPGKRSLSVVAQDSLGTFAQAAKPSTPREVDEESTSLVSSGRNTRMRGSFASILEMMSLTLAVMPSPSQIRGPVPLGAFPRVLHALPCHPLTPPTETETLDDLTATERAARTNPEAPPHLPPLPFADHAEEMAGMLYAPELLAPAPVIWLPNDAGGIGRSEAFDLQRYHSLQVTLDVRSKDDVLHRRSTSPPPPRSR
ncbi:uncharacterized protein PHACADRAFT_84832 [Phanerochaete carnosa HHB-10118-sp]|uniref:CSC1/OSCA1-like 7TM region domain-containing protein n=1 Tax=Phanerochaete carnosa (strain HHB-10118-sp) TaxID=650164 RepID=K5WQ59_PHACS|nr:uncharacterized protein PHACADRAFT_84832 [Phanerochaete carnosa HHB-10118-sp]EKM61349.1 hypothetical protein PHACADRAFT_84832 [Phanerochaete carnosa HHB-10118-sp]